MRMNASPMRLRFVSGLVTSASCSRKRALASTWRSGIARCSRNVLTTCSASPRRNSPLSTRRAATAESTPPESAQITLPSPTCARMLAIDSSTKLRAVQSPRQPATLNAKLRISWSPCGVCTTSG
jgi:hypothetical protein